MVVVGIARGMLVVRVTTYIYAQKSAWGFRRGNDGLVSRPTWILPTLTKGIVHRGRHKKLNGFCSIHMDFN